MEGSWTRRALEERVNKLEGKRVGSWKGVEGSWMGLGWGGELKGR